MNGYPDNVVANNKEENLLQNGYDNNEVTSKGKIDIDIGIVDDLKKLHVNDAVYQNGDKSSSIELNADKIFPSTDDKNTNNTQKSKDNKSTESSTITNGTPDENITKDSSAETNTKEKQRVLHFDHPVYKKISAANGIINRMHRDQLLTRSGPGRTEQEWFERGFIETIEDILQETTLEREQCGGEQTSIDQHRLLRVDRF